MDKTLTGHGSKSDLFLSTLLHLSTLHFSFYF